MKFFYLSLLVTALSSCVVTNTTRLNPNAPQYAAVAPEQVAIYLSESDVPKPFEKLAVINAKGDSSMTNTTTFYNKVKKDAAKLGANGILVRHVSEPSAGAQIAGAFLGHSAQRKAEYLAIRTK